MIVYLACWYNNFDCNEEYEIFSTIEKAKARIEDVAANWSSVSDLHVSGHEVDRCITVLDLWEYNNGVWRDMKKLISKDNG